MCLSTRRYSDLTRAACKCLSALAWQRMSSTAVLTVG